MPDILERILARKRAEVEAARADCPLARMEERARAAPPPRDFVGAVRAKMAAGQPAVIAEIKKASPSKGVLRQDFDPALIASSYAAGGAACLSVLTDRDFFQGAPEHLAAARAACTLPMLRKDFVVEPWQVYESRALGADCILLIAGALARQDMEGLEVIAHKLDMAVLVEVHDEAELESVLSLRSPLLGINNRNLRTFDTRLETTLELLPRVPEGKIIITESGISSPAELARMVQRGVEAFLIGEIFMRAPDPGQALERFLSN
ncbi:MAG TPA: indole-3-glycerol phosphate synthase TrpC [Burkholderiales bacterium]|nr:indole-3-glycerol phosphate synthase TrpC [Burkholderiales bacterium]